jgi:hypothetical protein
MSCLRNFCQIQETSYATPVVKKRTFYHENQCCKYHVGENIAKGPKRNLLEILENIRELQKILILSFFILKKNLNQLSTSTHSAGKGNGE